MGHFENINTNFIYSTYNDYNEARLALAHFIKPSEWINIENMVPNKHTTLPLCILSMLHKSKVKWCSTFQHILRGFKMVFNIGSLTENNCNNKYFNPIQCQVWKWNYIHVITAAIIVCYDTRYNDYANISLQPRNLSQFSVVQDVFAAN
jgi:hypothetical protein